MKRIEKGRGKRHVFFQQTWAKTYTRNKGPGQGYLRKTMLSLVVEKVFKSTTQVPLFSSAPELFFSWRIRYKRWNKLINSMQRLSKFVLNFEWQKQFYSKFDWNFERQVYSVKFCNRHFRSEIANFEVNRWRFNILKVQANMRTQSLIIANF
jgi:hypothetical protein